MDVVAGRSERVFASTQHSITIYNYGRKELFHQRRQRLRDGIIACIVYTYNRNGMDVGN